MITEKILEWGASLLSFITGSVSVPDPPGWISATNSPIAVVFQAVGSMGVWFPAGVVITVIGAVFAARLVGLGIKAGRMVLSLFTGGGGNAGGG